LKESRRPARRLRTPDLDDQQVMAILSFKRFREMRALLPWVNIQ
jgi:hypothetical protein